MDFWHSLSGTLRISLTSADVQGTISAILASKLEVQDIQITSPMCIDFLIRRYDLQNLRKMCEKRGEELEIRRKNGLYWKIQALRQRPVLVIGMVLLLLFTLWVPGRVFFVQVEGNDRIPSRKVAEVAAKCGIFFGSSRREVRSEKVKNALLEAMPELSWAGVNTYGCVAVITVREREEPQEAEPIHTVSSIVAERDGIIRRIHVLKGSAACKEGQVVKAGQVLISGYTDCGIHIQATAAKGEVYAQTERSITAVAPAICALRGEILETEKKISIIFGKKRVNLQNSSGIPGASCAKIYKENYITLPGGFVLPIAIAVETWVRYEAQEAQWDASKNFLHSYTRDYLLQLMRCGVIETADTKTMEAPEAWYLAGRFGCYEMIGTTKAEENIPDYVKND